MSLVSFRTPRDASWLPARIVRTVRRDIPLALMDLVASIAAYLAPLVLRFDGKVPERYWHNYWRLLPAIVAIHLAANFVFGLYGRMWRYASVLEARRVLLSGGAAGVLVVSLGAIYGRGGRPLPLTVIVFGTFLAVVAFGAVRFQSRLFAFRRTERMQTAKRALLVGAGDAGEMLLKDILRNQELGLEVVGLVDDDRSKLGRTLHGVKVMGPRSDIPPLVATLGVDQVLLAMPSATSEIVRDIAALCEEADVPLRVLPTVRETVGGRVAASDVRELRIEDLLGRTQVSTDLAAVEAILRDHVVLITGAGGSIGSEIVRQVAAFGPRSLVVLDHDETHLHELVSDLDPAVPVVVELADVRDFDRILAVFSRHRPDVVFHAAAHKHVPLLELHPEEAVRTNIVGTGSVVDAAVRTGVGRFVLISTDKAIRPVSVMGASKRIAEELVRTVQGRRVVFCAVRFGNVLGSRGSVIPTFLRQIARGGPVTVTDPSMTRYFMSVDEAVQLVLQAAAMAEGGEVLTLDMGEPLNILELARKIIRLSGHIPGREIEIKIIGPRPGEKVTEDIVDDGEDVLPSAHPKIVVSRPPLPDPARLRASLRELEDLSTHGEEQLLAMRLKEHAQGVLRVASIGGRD